MKTNFLPKKVTLLILLFAGLLYYPTLQAQNINTYAGTGSGGFGGDGGTATAAGLYHPADVFVDGSGNVFIADDGDNRIRKVTPAGIISTVAGTGSPGHSGDGGPATAATLNNPQGLTIDASGNIFIADYNNHCIRKVNTSGVITTFAGTPGTYGFSGDGGPATAAKFYYTPGVAVDASGNVYIADEANNRIRKVNTSGIISTVAGGGSSGLGDGGPATRGSLYRPGYVTLDGAGNMFIADAQNNRVRIVNSAGIINTYAGNGSGTCAGDGGAATAASLYLPIHIRLDASGNLYIADEYNDRIRKVNTSGVITTIAGTGTPGFSGDGGPATAAEIHQATGVGVDDSGWIYIADLVNNRIRRIGGACSATTAGLILGFDKVCPGQSITLTDSVTGGSWSSSDTSVATVSSSGVVSGVSAGTATITYSLTGICSSLHTTLSITVFPLPYSGVITGPSVVCSGGSITLTDTVSGGTWTATNWNATVTGGLVTGMLPGLDTIYFMKATDCGVDTTTQIITVDSLPNAGTITPVEGGFCPGDSILMFDFATSGTWISTNRSIATISGAGYAVGVSYGTDTVMYVASNACGSDTAETTISVLPPSVCKSGITSLVAQKTNLVDIFPNPNYGTFTITVNCAPTVTTQVIITNIVSQTVKTMEVIPNKETEIQLNAPAGVYFITVYAGKEQVTKKLVVE